MSAANNTMAVKILDKEYQVSCPLEERVALLDSARQLDERMRKVRASGNIMGVERIAVMVGLNLTYELMKAEAQPVVNDEVEMRLQAIEKQIEDALHQFENKQSF